MQKTSTAIDLPKEGFLCSGSNPNYRYKASISNGIVSVTMWIDDLRFEFTTEDKYRVAAIVHDYWLVYTKLPIDQSN